MSDPSSISKPTTWTGIGSAISSPASAGGPMRSGSPNGPTTDLFGRALVPVSPSAWLARTKHTSTSGIFGLRGCGSSESANLQECLGNRLMERFRGSGSITFWPTWKTQVTPQGRRICRLAATVLTTFAHGYGSLGHPTPTASDVRNRGSVGKTPSTTRRFRSGKQIGLSMLFDGMTCLTCVSSTMGYPSEWNKCAPTVTRSSRKLPPSSSKP